MDVELQRLFIITSVDDKTARGNAGGLLRAFLDLARYAFSDKTHLRKHMKPEYAICFYQSRLGIVADARIATTPEKARIEGIDYPPQFTWSCHLTDVRQYFESPIRLDRPLRSRLSAYKGQDIENWGWFVRGTHSIPGHDFDIITGRRYGDLSSRPKR